RAAGDLGAAAGVPEQRQGGGRLTRPRLADQPQHLAGLDGEADLVDDIVARSRDVDPQVGDHHRGPGGAHSLPLGRSIPIAARAMPSPTRPVPTVKSAIATTGRTTPHGWTASAIWFSWIITPQLAPAGSVAKPRKARPEIRAIE